MLVTNLTSTHSVGISVGRGRGYQRREGEYQGEDVVDKVEGEHIE